MNNAVEESTGSDNIKVYKTSGGITQTISVHPYEHKGPVWANMADILRITQAQLRLKPNMRHGSHKYIWNDGAPGVLTVFEHEDGTGELYFSTQDALIICIFIQLIITVLQVIIILVYFIPLFPMLKLQI